jgi:hypothetical protein
MIPDQQQGLLAFFGQSTTDPIEQLWRNARDGPATHEPQPYLFGICPQQPVTTPGFRLFIPLSNSVFYQSVFYQPQRFSLSPTVQPGLSQATPPYFTCIPQYPRRVLLGQVARPFTRLFLRAYCEPGLVSQSRARFHLTFLLRRALRIVSSDPHRFVSPRSGAPAASICNVQVERALPHWRGDWWSKAHNLSPFASASSGSAV